MNLPTEQERKMWQFPWSYQESFAIVSGIFFLGLLLEASTTASLTLPEWPYNLLFGSLLILFILVSFFMYLKNPFVRFVTSSEASIGAISLYAVLVLLMGIIAQDDQNPLPFGLSHIQRSWTFLMASIYLLYVLGLVVLRRLFARKKRKIAFILNHLGLWLIIFSAGIGNADLQRYFIKVAEGETNSLGVDAKNRNIKFPFEIKLLDFAIDEFPARLVLVDYLTHEIGSNFQNNASLIEKGKVFKTKNYNFIVDTYYPCAISVSDFTFVPSNDSMAGQAAKILITDKKNNKLKTGWISSGSPLTKSSYLPVDSDHFLAMTLPEPKKFSSKLIITDSKRNIIETKLEVNKPLKVDGWQLYQYSYDTEMGKYSKLSIIEAVKDPWVNVVYLGFFMLIAGSILLFYKGKSETKWKT